MSAPRQFTEAERTAIGELCEFATMLSESDNPTTLACGQLAMERAMNIVKGDAQPLTVSQDYVEQFAKAWR